MPSDRDPLDLSGVPLTLRTFGVAGLYAVQNTDPVLGPGKPLALLIYLAIAPGRRASRESLIDLLWSDLEPERARRALRQSLFHLRRLIGDDTVAGMEELTLGSSVTTDRDHFLATLECEDLEAAIAAYRGAFLPSFGVPGGAAFEHWADLERDRLQTSFIRAGELLVRRYLNRSQAKDGKRIARIVRDRAPMAEAAWRLVLESSVSAHDFVTATVEASALEQWAADERIVLETATRAAIIRARRIAPAADSDRETSDLIADLTGREREFSLITNAWDAVRTGPARHLHLNAPAGLGKTRLLRDVIARLAATGAPIVSLRSAPGDREVPYAFAADLAAALAALPGSAGVAPASVATLLALNPAVSSWLPGIAETTAGDEMLRRRIYALTDLAHAVAHEQPFVLAIDDVHWMDASSFRVIDGLIARLADVHVLCLTAARPERGVGVERSVALTLAPLDVDQVGALVAALGVIPPGEAWSNGFIERLHSVARGSPLLVLETLRLAIDQRAIALEGSGWQCLDDARLRALLTAGEVLRERVRALDDGSRRVLVLLATAGVPLDAAVLADMAGASPATMVAALAPLEQQGLIARGSSGWTPAHDEIAEAARTGLDDAEHADAERRIGEHFARTAGDDQHALVRAVRHLLAAGNDATVRELFTRYARTARIRGDRRAFAELASEFAGDDTAAARALATAIPRWWRAGLWSRSRQRAAAAVLALIPALTAGAVWRAVRDDGLQRLVFVDTTHTVSAIQMRAADWDERGAPLERGRASSALARVAFEYPQFPPAISPDGRSAAWIEDSGDSTTLDIWIRTPNGTRRLTREARDDLAQDWLPDGSALVGTTSRWSPRGEGDYDVAVFDTATGAARQITHGRAHDTSPRASPDGTRIAFTRETGELPAQLCVALVDGSREPECHRFDGAVGELVGWTSPVELAVIVSAGARRPLVIHDWVRNSSTEILGPQVYRTRMSPDRRWIVAAVRRDGITGFRDWVVPIGHPNNARPVAPGAGDAGVVRWWEGRSDASGLIQRLELADTVGILPLGIGTRLRVRALTATNGEVPLYAPITWTSSDSHVARVDSTGEVHPTDPGEVTITASLAGWRRVARTFHISGESSTTALVERWDGTWTNRWIPWGDTAPSVATGPDGIRGFANNGDGSFRSMAVSRQTFSARQGLGVQLRVSTPLTRFKSQRLRTVLVAGIDTAALLAGDQRKAPRSIGREDASCGMTFPEEGKAGAALLDVMGGISQIIDLGAAAAPLGSGAWWTLRLQILPDGRCGVAIDGRVIWLSAEPIPLDAEFRVRLGDESLGTTLLHGPLEVWTGVRTDVDWSRHP